MVKNLIKKPVSHSRLFNILIFNFKYYLLNYNSFRFIRKTPICKRSSHNLKFD
ncbi:hypothetical protein LEP1GSC151_0393 [Leptospira interrogans serovar Grippotyphosa str. LT2186]|uniref:Uncharacterized protein n=1 Tax=Leptospira interrogans serovar Grippotyphosa str. LT2186 TaxID=1001599 RepID=M3G109_LEPIR|nr:hypothetical protein LEP1GSC151_0393 [Leptospira interrogans serovar Grippotyphosa str. LT2186]